MRLNGLCRWSDGKENEQLHQCGDALGFDLCHGSVLGCVPRDLLEQSIGVSRGAKGEGHTSGKSKDEHRSFSAVSSVAAVDGSPLPPFG